MKLNRLSFSFVMFGAIALAGCTPQESAATATTAPAAPTATATAIPARQPVSLEVIAAQAKGFSVGSLMSVNTAYVFFDSQCPHCSRLWNASAPLRGKVKFVWIPVGMISASSVSQGAALLTSANPVALMDENEASILAHKGGIAASGAVAPEIEQAIKRNTALLNSFGAEGVPYVVAKNVKTGQMVTQDGASDTATLAKLLGIEVP